MSPAAAPPPPPALAGRLRQLREEQWPDQKVTQHMVAAALGLSDSTVSSYEKGAARPAPDRLRDYAIFFSTERTVANGSRRLLTISELTKDESVVYTSLAAELLALYRGGTDENSTGQVRRTWHFPDGAPVRLVCGNFPEEHLSGLASPKELNYTELLSYADLDALVELFGHIRAENPGTDVRFKHFAELSPNDFTCHVVLLGGFAWNAATLWSSVHAHFPVTQVEDDRVPEGEVFDVTETDGTTTRYLPTRDESPEFGLVEDVGLLVRTPNPYNRSRTLTICNGVHSRGVLGAVLCLTNRELRESNEAYIADRFGHPKEFGILMRVFVAQGKTMTPEFGDKTVTLFGWSKNDQ